ncbi:hypothetical protein B0H14DRAFT_2578932 [Mycena olivaceomarginata]|nr:hypothetical protein B0H14DRAFT_2578932 [Mycena olivaceomarginata]
MSGSWYPKGSNPPPITLAERPARKYEAVQSLLKQIIVEESKKSQAPQGVYQEAATESLSTDHDNDASQTDDAPEPEATIRIVQLIEPTDAKDVAERGFGLAQ